MNIKFMILMFGLFLFILGYVNQNKYNCNISPSLDRKIQQDLSNLFSDTSGSGRAEVSVGDPNIIKDYSLSDTWDAPSLISDEYQSGVFYGRNIDD